MVMSVNNQSRTTSQPPKHNTTVHQTPPPPARHLSPRLPTTSVSRYKEYIN